MARISRPSDESTGINSSVDALGKQSVHGRIATTPILNTMNTITLIDLPATSQPTAAFCGALSQQAGVAWPLAVALVAQVSRQPAAAAARFLDSTAGRYFGLCVLERLKDGAGLRQGIFMACAAWMNWKTDAFASKLYGAPAGAPYLLALIKHFGAAPA